MYIGALALCSQVVSPIGSNQSCVTLAGSYSSIFLPLVCKKRACISQPNVCFSKFTKHSALAPGAIQQHC